MTTGRKNRTAETVEQAQQTLAKSGYHHGDLKAALIDATRQLVEEKGPDRFSVADACRLAGVSTAAPYKHFKDKTEMLVATALDGMSRHRENTLKALEGIPPGSPDRITAIGLEYINFALNEPAVFRLKFGGFTDRIVDDELTAAGQQVFGVLLHEVALCIGQDEASDEVRHRGFLLWSFVHGLSFILRDHDLTKMGGDIDLRETLKDIARRMLD
ncbi:MAG: TetR/AcrR family transcriptional regulator [Pseudomonadota bacterium]